MVNTVNQIYRYEDENKNLLYRKVRVQSDDGSKAFYYDHEVNGQFVKGLGGISKVLYRLPQVLYGISKEQPIFICEGEKDVESLLAHTLFATTSPTTLEWLEEYTEALKNADVVILYDNDKTGLQHKNLLCEKLEGKIKTLKVVDLPDLEYREKGGLDITDWLQMGNTVEQLLSLTEQAEFYVSPNKLRVVTLKQLLNMKLPERKMLLEPFLPSQGLVMVVAKRGVGKTFISLGIAYAVATGGVFLRWTANKPHKVLYIDGEMPAILMQERLKMIIGNETEIPENLKLMTPDLQPRVMPDLSTEEGRKSIAEYIEDVDLVILDNISCLFRSVSENESESWQEAQEWALDLRRQGKSVLFVHHAGKSGVQRGTSKREDILDAVIILKHPDGYKQEEGARFEIFFDKARHFTGADARCFEVCLKEDGQGGFVWEQSETLDEALLEKLVILKKAKVTIKDIGKELKLTKGQVEWQTKIAESRGML